MSPEERRLLTDLFDRVRNAATTPRDREAEELIAAKLREQPYAAYFLAQAVIIQDQALQATTDRVQELEDEVRQLEAETSAARPQSVGFLGSLGSLFGGGQPATPPMPRDTDARRQGRLYDDYARMNREPAYEPAPGPWGRAAAASPWSAATGPSPAGGFLSGALTTAAGVAGGVLVADAVRDLFSSHVGGTAANAASALGNLPGATTETVVNNYFMNDDKPADKSNASTDNDTRQADDSGDDDSFDVADFGGGDDSFA